MRSQAGAAYDKARESSIDNVFDYIAEPAVRWQIGREEKVDLLIPKFTNRWMKKVFGSLVRNPDIHIHLDDFGSFIWQQLDGRRTLPEIGRALEAKFGASVQPVYERLGLFVNMLAQRKFITLRKP